MRHCPGCKGQHVAGTWYYLHGDGVSWEPGCQLCHRTRQQPLPCHPAPACRCPVPCDMYTPPSPNHQGLDPILPAHSRDLGCCLCRRTPTSHSPWEGRALFNPRRETEALSSSIQHQYVSLAASTSFWPLPCSLMSLLSLRFGPSSEVGACSHASKVAVPSWGPGGTWSPLPTQQPLEQDQEPSLPLAPQAITWALGW